MHKEDAAGLIFDDARFSIPRDDARNFSCSAARIERRRKAARCAGRRRRLYLGFARRQRSMLPGDDDMLVGAAPLGRQYRALKRAGIYRCARPAMPWYMRRIDICLVDFARECVSAKRDTTVWAGDDTTLHRAKSYFGRDSSRPPATRSPLCATLFLRARALLRPRAMRRCMAGFFISKR